ncbi:hypothetical protein [Roseateles sp. LYH14W]|uniref:VCBS repeat-containing protein n=1 Tax=Pelomonas parva TaxID=3299032 RepID=A0ABW7EY77_9BURK
MDRNGSAMAQAARQLALAGWLCVGAGAVLAQPYSPGPALDFQPGTAKQRDGLKRLEAVREIVEDRFSIAVVDLNDDGSKEVIVRSDSSGFCGSGGCAVVVLEVKGRLLVPLFSQTLPTLLMLTAEKPGGYRALAAATENGSIEIANKPGTPLHGKPMVYPVVAGGATAAAQPTPAAPAAPADERVASVLGIRLDMPADEAEALLRKHAAGYGGRIMEVNRYVYKANCAGCKGYDFKIEARMGVANRAAGQVAMELIFVTLAPPSAGGGVVSVVRTLTLKQPVSQESLVDQLIERHGKPGLVTPGQRVWYLDERRISSVPRVVKYPSGQGTQLCSVDPEERSSLLRQVVGDADTLRKTGSSEPLHPGCGTVLTLNILGQPGAPVSSFKSVLMDHRSFAKAGLAAHALLLSEQQKAGKKDDETVRQREAPRL